MIRQLIRPAKERAAAGFLVAAVSLLAAIATSGGAKADDLAAAPTAASRAHDNAAQLCASYGPGFILVGSDFCARTWGSVTAYGYKEFTDTDITMVGQRIPTPFSNGAGVPIAYYFLDNVSKITRDPGFGVVASADLLVKRETDYGSFTSFLRVVLDGSSSYDEYGHVQVGLRETDQSYYIGALDEAWVRLDGLKIGVQPSLFDFNRLPSVVTPGYTSYVTTPVSAEDSGRRIFGDGVLARPTRSELPDIVTLFRFRTPSTLFHLSGAVHQSEDDVLHDFAGGDKEGVTGWAWSAGLQSRIVWSDFLGEKAEGVYGRLGLTVANASGALDYLGIPLFAPDYVVMGNGEVRRSTGWSAVASYEHMLAPNLKFSTDVSYFNVTMSSSPEAIVPGFDPVLPALPGLDFSVNVQGTVFQVGLEYIPMPNLIVGIEGGYTWTEAHGHYVDVAGGTVDVGFPHAGVYVTKLF